MNVMGFIFSRILRLIVIVFILSCNVFAQDQNRVIEFPATVTQEGFLKGENGQTIPSDIKALEIVAIKIADTSVTIGQSFSAGDDWLKNLSVKLRNISEKPIASIRISCGLPETKNKNGQWGFSLEYGKALSSGIDYGYQKIIKPDEEVELIRNEAHYTRDHEGIAKRTGMTKFTMLLIGTVTVVFEDGTVWMSWKLFINN